MESCPNYLLHFSQKYLKVKTKQEIFFNFSFEEGKMVSSIYIDVGV